MNKCINFLVVLLIVLTFTPMTAQNSEKPWMVSAGFNFVGLDNEDLLDLSIGFPSVGLSRHITSGISLGIQYTISNKGNIKATGEDYEYGSIAGIIRYNIDVLKIDNLETYISGGYGLTRISSVSDSDLNFSSSDSFPTLSFGPGLNYYVNDNLSVNFSTIYGYSEESGSEKHLQHVVGLSYHFGSGDTDNDGIPDEKDQCPEIPGYEEFEGCPDTDGDGIPDADDECPEQAGSKETNGCPDRAMMEL